VPFSLRSTCIVEGPEIVSAPLVVKVPTTSGNVEKSYMAVMVTGVRVGKPNADGAESIVKKAIVHSAIAAEIILLCCIVSILLVVFFIVRGAFSFQLNLEIALGAVAAKVQPHGPLQPGRRCVETSDDVINFPVTAFPNECRALFATLLPCNLAVVIQSIWMRGESAAFLPVQHGSNGPRAIGFQCFRTAVRAPRRVPRRRRQTHRFFSSQSFWKRGSVRKGSQSGSSLKNGGVMGVGL
jgi:hypothetical protein